MEQIGSKLPLQNSNLIDDHVYAIKKDNQGNLWICTYGGISLLGSIANLSELKKQEVLIYPNPSNGNFTIECKNPFDENDVSIFDYSGRKIYSKSLKNGALKEEINTTNLSKGIYFVSLNDKIGHL